VVTGQPNVELLLPTADTLAEITKDYRMHIRHALVLLTFISSCHGAARAQIVFGKKVGDKTVMCMHSGLSSSLKECGTRQNWYTYVFVGSISAVTPTQSDEKELQLLPEEVFLGTPATPLTVLTSQADCMSSEFKVGDRWLFYLRKTEGMPIVLDYYANDSLPVADAQDKIATLRHLRDIGDLAILRGQVVRDRFSTDVIPNAVVTANRLPDNRRYFCATDEHGRYEFEPLPPGKYKVTVQTNGAHVPDDSAIDLGAGRCWDLTLARSAPSQIGGHVKRPDGTPIANIALVLIRGDNSSYITTKTYEDGHFAFRYQRPGEYVLGLNFPASPDWFDGSGVGNHIVIPPASMFYPDASDRSSALIIRLSSDQQLDDFNFTVPSK
jgi:hypothetical protein